MERNIICYCTSGLGNRLRPLSSAYAISKITKRKLLVYWDTITPNGCLANFNELFKNKVELITLDELSLLDDCILYTEGGANHGYEREAAKFGRVALKNLALKYRAFDKDLVNHCVENKNIIIYNNNFVNTIAYRKYHYEFLKQLEPIDEIKDNIDRISIDLKLNKELIGIHARGTDFGSSLDFYTTKINDKINKCQNARFFLSTEDLNYERCLEELYKNRLVFRQKKHYITKDKDKQWSDHTSFSITKDHAKEAVEDLYLLSKTNIQIYHPNSSFSQISRMLSE